MGKKRKPEVSLETTQPVPKKHKKNSEVKETTEGFPEQIKGRVELLETKSDQANLVSVKETVDETRKKTLFVGQLAPQTEISDIIDVFKSIGEVVRVRLVVDSNGKHVGDCCVEFASAEEANKALHHYRIFLVDLAATHPTPKYCIDHKVWNEDCLQLGSLPRKKDETPPDLVEKALFVANLSPDTNKIKHFTKFFQRVGKVVTVRLVVDRQCKHVGYGFVEFASADEAKRALEKKNGASLHNHKILLIKGHDETPDPVKAAAVRIKTLFVDNLKPGIKISHIIDFFKDAGEVVHVRLKVDPRGKLVGCGFVEFAFAKEAKKALQMNSKDLHGNQISLFYLADNGSTHSTPEYCIKHMVWYKDYLQRERLPIEKDETPPDFVEEVLFVANLSPQTTYIPHIIKFFQGVGEVVSVRLIVDQKGKHVGYGFVEFASADGAKRALEEKNGEYLHDHQILLMKVLDETPDPVKAAAVRIKTLFVANLKPRINLSHIIDFFKDAGEVVHVRLNVDPKGKLVGRGFVEFASAKEAKKALKKNGGYLHNRKILVKVMKDSLQRMKGSLRRKYYWIDHNVRYEDYLGQEEDAAVEVLDEEVAVREKTLFVANLAAYIGIPHIIKLFKDFGEVVRARLIVDGKGKHVGCAYVEFASANEAKKALETNIKRYMIRAAVAQIASYPFRPKYNLAEKLWYEDNLRRFGLDLEKKQISKPDLKKQEIKSLWSGKLTPLLTDSDGDD